MKWLQLALAALLFGLSAGAHAAFPDKPIKIIVGFPPGGPLDTHARLLVDHLRNPQRPTTLP